ncbi:hypothetical protein HN51_057647 [Arachis hypogaea]|uniref:SCP domain-containing protein n=1 Tax=Arachis hypogaea TaxID=3818 RepID=A0A444WXY8_ARAHY|nr:pathogenesis-related protein 1-like [Arachis ipaensis]XP_025683493.1 pathogenesis-related protein 1-like [Arachis hypogaea]QHN80471.1 Pathogenesis-related protein [Arachis hypogaea]RYQ82255.1 hypothetical protein Ahy_B10g100852 [Arachis hypogaea]
METLWKFWVVIINFVSVVPWFLLAQNFPKDYLKAHNNARAEVGVKPLKWDPKLELHARKYVKKYITDCKKGLFDVDFAGTYGQNNAYNPGSISGIAAVDVWVKQKTNYDYESNSCVDGTMNCSRYAQVVWSATTRLGCARVKCRNYGGTLVTCLYHPEGNTSHERPYVIH